MDGSCPKSSEEASVLKFTMPAEPADQIRMYRIMLRKVQVAVAQINSRYSLIDSELEQRIARGEDAREILQAKRGLREEQLCLLDQEKRLQERISSLQLQKE